MRLDERQEMQVRMQLDRHRREPGVHPIDPGDGTSLDLYIASGVFGSDFMSSGLYTARFLHAARNRHLYVGKDALDMGCGAGIQGIVMAKNGAKSIDLADINPRAVENATINLTRHNIRNASCYVSDLFVSIPRRRYGCIVFNHPFFPEDADAFVQEGADTMLKRSMLGGTGLLETFMSEAGSWLADDGAIIMPYFHMAGPENDPANHTHAYGLDIVEKSNVMSDQGVQLGDFSIYTIRVRR